VTLELGFAMAETQEWYIAINPQKTKIKEVPSDLRGLDRLEYLSLEELKQKIAVILDQRYKKQRRDSIERYLGQKRTELRKAVKTIDGVTIGALAELMGVEVGVARLVIKPLLGKSLRQAGTKKGTRYYRMQRGPIPKKRQP
jgi:hypothetical protein